MDAFCQLQVGILIVALTAGALANQPVVSSNHPNGAKAGDEVTFTCSFEGQSLAFGDAIHWGRVNDSAFDLIVTNTVVEPPWRNLATASLGPTYSSLTLKVLTVSQTGSYRCLLFKGGCTPSPATTCVTTYGEAALTVYGSVERVSWHGADNGTLTVTVDVDTQLEFVIEATSDVSEYAKVYLGVDEITNNIIYTPHRLGDRWQVTGRGSHRFTAAHDRAVLKVEVSVPLHSKSSEAIKVAVRTYPTVDCPDTVAATLGDAAQISCVVTSFLPLTSAEWVYGEGETAVTIIADGGEVDGLSSSLTSKSESKYIVDLRTQALAKHHVRTFKLAAVNDVGRRTDDTAFHEALPPAEPEKAISDRQTVGSNEAARPATGVLRHAVLAFAMSSLAASLWR